MSEEIPEDVRGRLVEEGLEVEDCEIDSVEDCAICNASIFSIEAEDAVGRYLYDERGDDAWVIEDQGSVPRQLDLDKSFYMCGGCSVDIDVFERGLEIVAANRHGDTYGAFSRDTIIQNHYRVSHSFDRSRFSEAFESIVLGEDNIELEDGTKMVRVDEDFLPKSIRQFKGELFEGNNLLSHDVIIAGNSVYVPEDEVN